MQIALGAAVLFAAAWFLFLKPKPASDESASAPVPAQTTATQPSSSAPGVTGLKTAVDKAKGAHNAESQSLTNAANASAESGQAAQTSAPAVKSTASATTKTATKGSAAVTPAGPAVKNSGKNSGDPSDGLLAKLVGRNVVVLLFVGQPRAGDDNVAVRSVLSAARSVKGTTVRITGIRNVGRYSKITDKLEITESPSAIIMASDKKAQVLTGILSPFSVKQYILDGRRRATGTAK